MFTVKDDLTLREFDSMVGFWQGAKSRWESMTEEEKDVLEDYAEGLEFTSLTQVNDFIWFDSDDILERYHAENEPDEEDEDEEDEDQEAEAEADSES